MTGLFSLTPKRQKKLQKFFSGLAIFSLFLQIGSGIFYFKPAFAEDQVTPTEQVTPTPEPTAEPTLEATPTPTLEATPTIEATPTVEPTPEISPEATPTPIPTEEATPTPTIENSQSNQENSAPPNETSPPAPSSNDTSSATPSENTPTPTVTVEQPIENGQLNAVILKDVKADSIPLDLVSADIEGSATLVTDKADYAPTDTALISGSGFNPGETYTLIISSTDEPPVNFEAQVTADGNGTFVYAYQLDGNYRPNYKVEVKDKDGKILAAITFTDSNQITYDTFEGEIALQGSNNWTTGNISGYKEGDTIRFRVELDSDSGSFNGHLFIGFTSKTSCRFFKFQDPTNVALDFNRATDAIDAGSGFTATFTPPLTQNGNDGVADFALTSSASKHVRLNFTLQVDDNAAACASGSSQHVQIDHVNGDIKSSGNKALPIPASAVTPVTDITVSKTGTANASIGGVVSYTVTVTNLDTTPASSVVATDTLPAGITGTTATYDVDPNSAGGTGNCALVSQVFTCNIGTLGGNDGNTTGAEPDVAVITVNGTVNNNTQLCSTSLTNNVSVSTTTLESNTQNNSAQASTNINACQTTLKLVKQLTNDNGGSSIPYEWALTATGTNGFSDTGDSTTFHNVNATTYTLSESGPTGYSAGNWSCNAGSLSGNQLTLSAGQTVTCTITNNDVAPTLTLVKYLPNDNGGTATQDDFNVYIDGQSAIWGQNTVSAGSHTVSEDILTGYTPSAWGDDCNGNGTITLLPGDNKTCTITNNDQPGTLIVKKVLINGDGGTKDPEDFSFKVNGGNSVTFEVDGQNDLTVNAGTYSVVEDAASGYLTTYDNCNGVVIANGGSATCTITNDDIEPTLTLVKEVTNNDGGGATAFVWTLSADGSERSFSSNGPQVGPNVVKAGVAYTLTETGPDGYTASAWDCNGGSLDGNVLTLALGEEVTCTITNDDIAPTLTLIKTVVNDYGGNKVVADFPLFIDANPATSGVVYPLSANTEYTVSETNQTGYTPSVWGGDCTSNGTITLNPGDNKTCTITNSDIQPTLTLVKTVDNNYSGDNQVSDFNLYIDGVAATSGVAYPVTANQVITASEDSVSGYTPSVWGIDCTSDGTITLLPGDTKTCTITNSDIAPTITLIKTVNNDYGGNAQPDDFGLTVDDNPVLSGATTQVDANTEIVIDEAGLDGYNFVSITGDGCPSELGESVILDEGQNITCTITNDDIQPLLTVTKVVDGGDKPVADFPLFVDQTGVVSDVQTGFNAGTYTVSETNQTGYTPTITGDCASDGTINLAIGDVKSCTITNTRDMGDITVIKNVDMNNDGDVDDEGDTLNATDWTWDITNGEQDIATGQSRTLATDSYTISEDFKDGYHLVGWSCDNDSSGTDNSISFDLTTNGLICTFTNARDTGDITILKNVDMNGDGDVNDEGDIIGATNWTWDITNGEQDIATGQSRNLLTGAYAISEDLKADYELVGWSCSDEDSGTTNSINIDLNTRGITCTFTNKFNPPTIELLLSKTSTEISGKTASPGDTITYTLTVTNNSDFTAYGVAVQDSLPDGFSYVSGTTTGTGWTPSEPTINSNKLTWAIGQIPAGESVVINYDAKISSSLADGSYPNIAIASGYNRQADGTLSRSGFAEFYTAVGAGVSYSAAVAGGTVLGAATGQVLGAATGSPTYLLIIAMLMILGGLLIYFKKGRKLHV